MPTNWLADKLLSESAKTRPAAGVIRRVQRVDVNNVAASLEQQTRGLSGGNKSAQGAVAVAIARKERVSQSNPAKTSQTSAAKTPTSQSTGQNVRGGGLGQTPVSVLYRYVNTKVVGGQVLRITTTVWLLANGSTKVTTQTEVVGQSNRPR